MELQLPATLISMVEVGGGESSYALPTLDERGALATEPGERVLQVLTGEIRCSAAILSPQTSILVTSHRCAWIDPSAPGERVWLGGEVTPDAPESAPPQTASGASSRRAVTRSPAGHVRHEWVTELRLRRQHSVTGDVDAYLDLVSLTSRGARTVTWWLTSSVDPDVAARAVARAAAGRWLEGGPDLLTPADLSRLTRYLEGTGEEVSDRRTSTWTFPGEDVAVKLVERLQ